LGPCRKYYGLKPKDEDLGQTFGFYGIGNGFYIVWPFLGSSSLRDSVGLLGDRFLNPVSYVKPWEVSIGITGYQIVNRTSFKIGDYEAVKEAAIDPYEALKDGYIQYRTKRINE
jgi:phospholipid-binding lipoprotein MlaA